MDENGTFFIHLILLTIVVVSCVKTTQKEQGSKELNSKDASCCGKEGEVCAIYLPHANGYKLNPSTIPDNIGVEWFIPLRGGDLQ